MKVTRKFIKENCTIKGGYTKIQLAILGVSWPPKSGWIESSIDKEITEQEQKIFIKNGKVGTSNISINPV